MNAGMLWFDNDPRTTLIAKVERAVGYYRTKYGHTPDLCLVNPAMLPAQLDPVQTIAGKVSMRPNRAILPGHLWIGCEERRPEAQNVPCVMHTEQ